MDNLWRERAEELVRCSESPIYFIENYVTVRHPNRGTTNPKLYNAQKETIENFKNNKHNIVRHARQTGVTTISWAYALWHAIFKDDQRIMITSHKIVGARHILEQVRIAYENLPHWLAPPAKRLLKESIELENGSIIMAASVTPSSVKGLFINLLYMDNYSFVPTHKQLDFWKVIYPVLCTGGTKIIVAGLPSEVGQHFKELWGSGRSDDAFARITINWDAVDGRDEEFKRETIKSIGYQQWIEEYELTAEGK